jgi:transcriptional regulator with GAF, ATPase, and Fis domain
MIEEIGGVLSRTELLASYRRADQYIGDRASQSEHESLRRYRRLVMLKLEKLESVEEELIGGTLEDEVNHFEASLIARALERENGNVTRTARALGLTPQGLSKILNGRHSKTLGWQTKKESL